MVPRKEQVAMEEEAPEENDEQKVKRPYNRFNYTEDDLALAISRVKEGAISINKAAKIHGIPKGTLFNKVTGKVPLKRKMGPPTVLSEMEEENVKNWILNMAKLGFPMHGEDVKDTIQKVLKECPRSNPFTDDRPGNTWLNNFLKRHPEISKRNSDAISKARASVTKQSIINWFTELREFLANNDCLDIFDDSRRVLNCDETGCLTCPVTGKVLGPKNFKNLYEVKQGDEKESITVLCCFSADGSIVPPMVVYPYKRIPAAIVRHFPEDWGFGRSDSGWMVSETFVGYVTKVLKPWLEDQKVPFPVILFLDGHKSHLSMQLSDYCEKNKIIIYCLPPNATHIIQPCDVAIFRPLKVAWRAIVRKTKQNRISINKTNFAGFFKQAFDLIRTDVVKSGFATCGLYPLNENVIDFNKCLSVRQAEIDGQSSELIRENAKDHMSQSDYATTKKVIERIFPKELIEKFDARLNGEMIELGEDKSLFLLWKNCREKILGLTSSNSFCNAESADCLSSVLVNGQSDTRNNQFVFDDEFNCIPLNEGHSVVGTVSSLNDGITASLNDSVDDTVSPLHAVSSTSLNEFPMSLSDSFLLGQPSHSLENLLNVDVDGIDTWIPIKNTCDNDGEVNINNTKDDTGTAVPIIDLCISNEGRLKDCIQLPIVNSGDNVRACPASDSQLNSTWSNCLKLPEKPEKTSGKENKPHVPFCITSAEWREMQQQKIMEKEEQEKAKLEKKKLREEKKIEKQRMAEEKKREKQRMVEEKQNEKKEKRKKTK